MKNISANNTENLATEKRNPLTASIDRMDSFSMLQTINNEDQTVPLAVEKELPNIALAVDAITNAIKAGGRLFYCGAGTSGRLGVLDASECPPTFGTDPGLVVGLIAGGSEALLHAIEGAEDSDTLCVSDFQSHDFKSTDILCGIAASGRTPYVIGGMKYARSVGAKVISITCSPDSEMSRIADIAITPIVGPEVITGSTRLKAGTAQKLVLNMLTTATMIKLGRVYGNLMVDVQPTNKKLIERAKRIVSQALSPNAPDREDIESTLSLCGYRPKVAIVMLKLNVSVAEAEALLEKHDGHLYKAL